MLFRTWGRAAALSMGVGASACPGPPKPPGPVPEFLCPNGATNCTSPNGTGIYTAEGGHAAIGRFRLVITHFINHTASTPGAATVSFEARYPNPVDFPNAPVWFVLPASGGLVASADYRGQMNLRVIGVHEAGTVVQWTLFDPRQGTTIQVGDDGLADLTLYAEVRLGGPGTAPNETDALTFRRTTGSGGITSILRTPAAYELTWRSLSGSASPAAYCFDAQSRPDPVVFQQGIDVDPLTGVVTRGAGAADTVTLSCSEGAPAVVYSWGYDYGESAPTRFQFDAGLHMKRASYCGDSAYFTVAGTRIAIADDQQIQRPEPAADRIEASWGPSGALCLDPENMRHPEMGFSGSCRGAPLPRCPSSRPTPPFLVDAPVRGQ